MRELGYGLRNELLWIVDRPKIGRKKQLCAKSCLCPGVTYLMNNTGYMVHQYMPPTPSASGEGVQREYAVNSIYKICIFWK
jgi:hypothetical protein